MSKAPSNINRLLNGMLEEGLSYVAAYLGKSIKYPIIFADVIGRIHYPDEPGTPSQLDLLFTELPKELANQDCHCQDHYYDEENRILYVRVGQNRGTAYIIVTDLPPEMVDETRQAIDCDAQLAVKHYFYNLEKLRESQSRFKQELVDYLFYKGNTNIRDLIKASHDELQVDKPYLVSIMEADQENSDVDWQILSSYTTQHLKRIGLEIIPVSWPDGLLAIFPASYRPDTLEIDPDWTQQIFENSFKFRDIIGRIFERDVSIALGNVYTLIDLHKSYNEARFAMTLAKLLGKKNFVQPFSQMGVFTQLFSQDIESLKTYVQDTLGTLIEYDRDNNTELLCTLRKLLDNNFSWKCTAKHMHTHVNTIYYRVNKIEELMNVGLSNMETRVNLYIAIKVWDTLRLTGFLN